MYENNEHQENWTTWELGLHISKSKPLLNLFQSGTIIITLWAYRLPCSESHHRTSSSPLLRTFLLLSYHKGSTCLG